jgi:hypothetical protein
MKQKPVAWMMVRDGEFFDAIHPDEHTRHEGDYTVPLYTAPKELSDEEIIEIGNAVVNLIDSNEGWIEFARAILKKASE